MNVLKKHDVKLLLTDTDSFVYEIKTDDFNKDFRKDKHLLDLRNYPKDSKIFDSVNEEVIGKMKDESKGKTNAEFVGIKSKMQPIKYFDGKENKTGKGVNKNVVKNRKHEEYIRHNETFDVSKISLSCFNDKRHISDDGINNLAYFHKDTRSQQN